MSVLSGVKGNGQSLRVKLLQIVKLVEMSFSSGEDDGKEDSERWDDSKMMNSTVLNDDCVFHCEDFEDAMTNLKF